jgi:2-amino-4-hydroxy-6-hydroxymethyldihydropteridine diphosphokinase/dihydropteroate synthase
MVILGLGSNVGDRLAHLRNALTAIKKIPGVTVTRVAPVYWSDALLPDNAESGWDMPYLNTALLCETKLPPYELLEHTKRIETELGREVGYHWGPRPLDIDILAWDDLVQYDEKLHIPHEHLSSRPFALWPLADVAPHWVHPLLEKTALEIAAPWGSRFSGEAPLHTRQLLQRIDTPQLVGIMNITPDSFSDGSLDAHAAIKQAQALVTAGAEILDLGAEASNPKAIGLSAEIEWHRLEPVLLALLEIKDTFLIPPKISVDTRRASIAAKALALGADWINDVGGLTDPAMCNIIADSDCDVVMMHQLGIPAHADTVLPLNSNPVKIIYAWAEQQLELLTQRGINKSRIIFDVGIGFGKNATQSLALLQGLPEFQLLNQRLLVGQSRKSFLSIFTDATPTERDIETLPISLHLSTLNIQYLRLHNVEYCARAFKVARALI